MHMCTHFTYTHACTHARTHLDDEGVGEVVDGDLVNAVDLLPLRVRVPTGKCARACARARVRENVCAWRGCVGRVGGFTVDQKASM